MASSGKGSKSKGKSGELQLMHILRDFYGYEDVRRGKVFQNEPDIVGLHGIHIECKRVEGMKVGTTLLTAAMLQSEAEAMKKDGDRPIVIHRQNGEKEWKVTTRLYTLDELRQYPQSDLDDYMVTMTLKSFMDIYGAWYKANCPEE